MTFALSHDQSGGVTRLTLTGQADVARAWDIRSALLDVLQAGASVMLTLKVDRMDAAGAQLVLAMHRYVAARGGQSWLEVASEAAHAALSASGVLDLVPNEVVETDPREGETR